MITAIELLNDAIIPVEITDRVHVALRQMDELKIAHLPLIEDKKLVGILSESELLGAENEDLPIGKLALPIAKQTVRPDEHFYSVLSIMAENNLSVVPVCDEKEHYFGAVTLGDVVYQSAKLLSVNNPGGIIILNVTESDFSLTEISRIVESNDTKILSLGTYSLPGTNMIQVTLKLNKINVEPVLQTFNRFNYEVLFYFGENAKDEELLRQRYESLMMYLKI